jgi:DNA mismatch repair protein MutS2
MNQQSFTALEYTNLRQLMRRYAQTPMGADRLESLEPLPNRDELQNALNAVDECVALRERGAKYSFSNINDPGESLAVLRIENAALEPLAMLDLANLIEQALSARLIILSEKQDAPTLLEIVEKVPRDLQRVSRRLQDKILPGGILDDRASPELSHLRNEINRLRERISRSLDAMMKKLDAAMQDEFVTIRNDRFVIPVKADFRGKVQGVAHGFSSSGQTIFLEPLSTIEANNELQALREAEEREIARVLFDLTENLRYELENIEAAIEAVTELDFINAKATFLRDFSCVVPKISETETLYLHLARHPLLEESLRQQSNPKSEIRNPKSKDVVPISFELTKEKPVMIISGANAGGKTVVLKTAGLLSLMAVSGLPVPAVDAQVPFYQSILADIGDQQSISANLSTFTSHVSNIAQMMEICETPALVLLDEVGTGTDPEEGSALGVAVVNHFRQNCRAQVMASTHYRGLKMYAANNEFVQNASVEFDEKTLQPTYQLRVGLAGVSAGIEIAQRFGIPNSVVENAKANVERSSLEASEYLMNLRREVAQAEDLRRAVEEERAAVAEKYAALERDFQKRETERRKEFEKQLAETVDNFTHQSKGLLETIEDKTIRAKIEKETQARQAELKRAMAATLRNTTSEPSSASQSTSVPPAVTGGFSPQTEDRPLEVGLKVLLKNFGSIGTIEKIEGETAEILVGAMRLREKVSNLQAVAVEKPNAQSKLEKLQEKSRKSGGHLRFEEININAELNLVGKRTAEAEDLIDKFLDTAYLQGFQQVRIIHGIGTGALKTAVHTFLKGHPHVHRYTLAEQDQGGHGATIVELKQ